MTDNIRYLLEMYDRLQSELDEANAKLQRIRQTLQTWDTPTSMDLEILATEIKKRITELEIVNAENKKWIEELLEKSEAEIFSLFRQNAPRNY